MKYGLTATFLLLFIATYSTRAQDVHFSQFYENATMRNPALTGIFTGDYKVGVNYRNQWSTFATPFQTFMVNAEVKALVGKHTGDFLSFGLSVVQDKAGEIDFNGTSIYGTINFNKAMGDKNNSYLSVGLGGGYVQRSVNVGKMRFANQFSGGVYNPSAPSNETFSTNKINNYDAAAGISFASSLGWNVNYYIGGAAYHIAQPPASYDGDDLIHLNMRWTGSFGIRAALNTNVSLVGMLDYQQQDPYREIIGGVLVGYLANNQYNSGEGRKLKVYIGCLYRFQDAIIPTLRMDYGNWGLTASYDVSMNSKRIYFNGLGGYEMSLFVRGKLKTPKRFVDDLVAPRFELEDDPAKNPYH